MRSLIGGLTTLLCILYTSQTFAQSDPSPTRWEISLAGQIGVPSGYIKVGENRGVDVPGTRLGLHGDLGLNLSGAAEVAAGYHLTPRDSLRLSLFTFFLEGSTTLDRDIFYNGTAFVGGSPVDFKFTFPRFTLAYERDLLPLGEGGGLSGTVGLTYVSLNAVLRGTGPLGGRKESPEDFFRQELPIPLLGLRAEYPLAPRLRLVASLAGGYLPWVDSLRSEGGTVRLTQAHVDGYAALSYTLTPALSLEGGYRYTYFSQHEKSHEDDNLFVLSDSGVVLGLTVRF